jgi:hypothetical protein
VNELRRYQLLERPASGEQFTVPNSLLRVFSCLDVFKIYEAHNRFPVPAEHRVDRLRELSATALIDATGIDPDIVQSLHIPELTTRVFNIRSSSHASPVLPIDISEGNLFRAPLEDDTVSLPVVQI